ncbi:TerC family protein [Cellvibrio sp.]|uniref:TerC family protein n=1 Tax=Cellvibrio sp. TaxID=1965322 RepID=UPI0039647419
MFEWIASPEAWVALATLTALEIVLGIDNIIFLSILVGRLPEHQRALGRTLGLGFAMLTRLGLLFSLTWVMSLTHPFISPFGYDISGRDIILIGGGLFLLYKATVEIHQSVEGGDEAAELKTGSSNFFVVILQIAILDIVFSLDSVITAVGLVSQITLMAIAIVIAVGVMMFAARSIGEFVENHPTVKVLALSFLVVVGVTLVMEGFDVHVPKGYIYFAMAFSLGVEMINIRMRKKLAAKSE